MHYLYVPTVTMALPSFIIIAIVFMHSLTSLNAPNQNVHKNAEKVISTELNPNSFSLVYHLPLVDFESKWLPSIPEDLLIRFSLYEVQLGEKDIKMHFEKGNKFNNNHSKERLNDIRKWTLEIINYLPWMREYQLSDITSICRVPQQNSMGIDSFILVQTSDKKCWVIITHLDDLFYKMSWTTEEIEKLWKKLSRERILPKDYCDKHPDLFIK